MPSLHQGVQFRSGKDPVLYLRDPKGIDGNARRKFLDGLARLNELRLEDFGDPEIDSRISQYEMNPEVGGFAIIEVVLPEHVQVGTILAIRRNTGVLGQVTITDITADGAIGNPMPGFGPVDPQAGDELIIPPTL